MRELLFERGEASGIALGREVAERYRGLAHSAREAFFLTLLKPAFLPDPQSVLTAAEKYRSNPDSETLAGLFAAVETPRQELFRRINLTPGGTEALVRMREDLLRFSAGPAAAQTGGRGSAPSAGFLVQPGFLRLERIDWRTPAAILEKLIEHEAVHEIRGWDDLRRRLARDRRCFAFFHPALADEPLIFVEVALTGDLLLQFHPCWPVTLNRWTHSGPILRFSIPSAIVSTGCVASRSAISSSSTSSPSCRRKISNCDRLQRCHPCLVFEHG